MDEPVDLAAFFRSPESRRDKFLARLFGLFSEDLVRDWCTDPRAPYDNLGRPTLWGAGDSQGSTLDFTLRDRATQRTYVSEMKVELEFDGYKYMTLERLDAHHRLPAFQRFLEIAREPTAYEVRVGAKPTEVDGAILIWGAVSEDGRQLVTRETKIQNVLAMDSIVRDLRVWQPVTYLERLDALRRQPTNCSTGSARCRERTAHGPRAAGSCRMATADPFPRLPSCPGQSAESRSFGVTGRSIGRIR